MFERFTEKAIKTIMLAQEESRRLGLNFVTPEMILAGVVGLDTKISDVLKDAGLTLKEVQEEIEKINGRGSDAAQIEMAFTESAMNLLQHTFDEMLDRRHRFISAEHLVLGILRLDAKEPVHQVFSSKSVDCSALKEAIVFLLKDRDVQPETPPFPPRPGAERRYEKRDYSQGPQSAPRVIDLAQEEARRLGHNFVGTEQILLGLIGAGGRLSELLADFGLDLLTTRIAVERIIGRGSGFVAVEIPFTPRARRALEYSWVEARELGHNFIGREHLLLGLLRESEGVASEILKQKDVDIAKLRKAVIGLFDDRGETGAGVRV